MRIECKYDEMMPLEEVEKRWHPDNENNHPEEQVRSLTKVIAKIGIRHAIHISKLSGKIAGGHGRFLAFKKLGYDEAPIIWENFNDELEEINYRASDNIGQYAEFNNQEYVLNLEKVGVDIHEVDLEEFGLIDFTPEIEVIEPECDPDAVPEVKEDPITKRGDVWLLGDHRIMCGDSTMIDDVEKLMNGEKVDMVFTDPPYGMNLDTDYSKMGKAGIKHKPVLGDNDDFSKELINTIFYFENAKEIFVWGADYFAELIQNRNEGSWIVWDKCTEKDINTDWSGKFGSEFELCWSKEKKQRVIIRKLTATGYFARGDEKKVHPTQKPVKLAVEFFDRWGKNYNCADLFLGSGSTLIACEKTNRKCYGMELDEKYVDVIIRRWQDYTKKDAILESSGETYNALSGNTETKED